MGWRKRIKKKIRKAASSAVGKVEDYGKRAVGGVEDYGKRATENVTDYGKRAKEQAIEGYRRYKDPIIVGAGTALGAILGSVVPGIGTVAGAMAGASLAGGARAAKVSRDQAKDAERQMDAFNAQYGGEMSLADLMRRRRLRRGAGEGVAEYESEGAGSIDSHEVAA